MIRAPFIFIAVVLAVVCAGCLYDIDAVKHDLFEYIAETWVVLSTGGISFVSFSILRSGLAK